MLYNLACKLNSILIGIIQLLIMFPVKKITMFHYLSLNKIGHVVI